MAFYCVTKNREPTTFESDQLSALSLQPVCQSLRLVCFQYFLIGVQQTFRPFSEGEEERTLTAELPYADIYLYYLAAMIDFYNGDSGRYNDTMVLFNQAWEDYAAYYRRRHKPKQTNLRGMLAKEREPIRTEADAGQEEGDAAEGEEENEADT